LSIRPRALSGAGIGWLRIVYMNRYSLCAVSIKFSSAAAQLCGSLILVRFELL
jgi:hypothetical protein